MSQQSTCPLITMAKRERVCDGHLPPAKKHAPDIPLIGVHTLPTNLTKFLKTRAGISAKETAKKVSIGAIIINPRAKINHVQADPDQNVEPFVTPTDPFRTIYPLEDVVLVEGTPIENSFRWTQGKSA